MSVSEPPEPPRGRTAEQLRSGAPAGDEPPAPRRGLTAEESASDASAAELEVEAATSVPKRIWALIKPGFLLSQADGYPIGIKQFLQFCLILVYPAWLFVVVFGFPVVWVAGKIGYGLLWVLFWPVRLLVKKPPDEPEAGKGA